MTTLLNEMEKRDISTYKLVELMGKSPKHVAGYWKKKIEGEVAMSPDQLREIVKIISEHSGEPLKADDIEYEIVKLKVV